MYSYRSRFIFAVFAIPLGLGVAVSKEGNGDKFEVVKPSLSILGEPTVSVIGDVAHQPGAHEMTKADIDYLYSTKAQDITERRYYRPGDEKVIAKYAIQFPQIELFTINKVFGGWKEGQNTHYSNGGVFDQMHGSRVDPATDEVG